MQNTFSRKFSGLIMALLLIIMSVLPGCTGNQKVTISSLVISPEKISVNEVVSISANILSSEEKDTFYQAELLINGEKIESKEVSISPGETKMVSFSYTPSELGTYTADINGQTGSFEVVNAAKFEPGELTVTPQTTITGEEMTLSVTVKNTGGLSGTYATSLIVDNEEISNHEVAIDPAGQEALTATYIFDTSGPHSITFCGYDDEIQVLKAAEFTATSVSVSPSSIYTWESATVTATITNTGDVSGTFPVDLMVNGLKQSSKEVTLEANSSTNVSFTVSRDTTGRSTVEVLGKTGSFTIKELEQYESEVYYYTISYPSGYDVIEVDPASILIEGSTGQEGGLAILVDKISVQDTAEDYLNAIIEGKQAQQPDWTATNIAEIKNSDTIIGYTYDYSHTLEGKKWKGIGQVIKNGGYGYYIAFSSYEPNWSEHTTIAEKCLDSFVMPTIHTGVYNDPEKGIKIDLPDEWNAIETGNPTNPVSFTAGYNQPGIFGNLVVEESGGYSAEDYIDYFMSVLDNNGYSSIRKSSLNFVHGYESYQCTGSITIETTTVKVRIVCAVANSMLYSFTFNGLNNNLDTLASDITSLVQSLEISTPTLQGYDRNETLVLWGGEIPNLDPALTETVPGSYIGALFSGLVKLDRNMEPVGDIAESWTVSDDGTTYTFKLRSNATFHDGKQVTADDVKYSWERACDPDTDSDGAKKFLNDIVGADAMFNGTATSLSGVTVINDTTLEVKIDAPKVYFLDKLTQCVAFVVDRTNVQQGSVWYENPNGTGPFKLIEWEKDNKLIMERNDAFYTTPAKLKYIYFKLYAGIPITMYETGEIDIATVTGSSIDRVLDTSDPLNAELMIQEDTTLMYVSLNNSMAPFDDPKVRLAFAYAIDVDQLIETFHNNRAEPAGSYRTPTVPGFNASLQPIGYDPEMALQLIAESSYGSVENLPTITVSVPLGLPGEVEAIIGMWQQNLGIQVEVEVISTIDSFIQQSQNQEFHVHWNGWGLDYFDAQNFLEIFFHSDSPVNSMAYSNPEIDAALEAAGAETDETARLQQYKEIEERVLADLPMIPLYHSISNYILVKPYVEGFALYPIDINIWTEIYLDPH